MELHNPVLVVVDLQVGFLNANSEHVVANVITLLEGCTRRKIPAVFTKFINLPASPFKRLLEWPNVSERPETDLCGPILPYADVVIEKYFYTAVTDEFLRQTEAAGWKTVLICGVSTESCVLKTAVDAFEKDLTPIVIADACASDLGNEIHFNALEIMKILIGKGQVVNTDALLNML